MNYYEVNSGTPFWPNDGLVSTTNHTYRTLIRHVNCPQFTSIKKVKTAPTDCSSSTTDDIALHALKDPTQIHEMEVCKGGCNELKDLKVTRKDKAILKILRNKVREHAKAAHPIRPRIRHVAARVVWDENLSVPVPAYFSSDKKKLVAHSSIVSSGHLAIMQKRGLVDRIEVDFLTSDRPVDPASRRRKIALAATRLMTRLKVTTKGNKNKQQVSELVH